MLQTVILCWATFSSQQEKSYIASVAPYQVVNSENCGHWQRFELETVPSQDGRTWGWARVPGSSSPLLSTHQHCRVTGWHWMGSKLPSSSLHFGRYNCPAGIPVSWALCSRMARMCWHAETQHSSVLLHCFYRIACTHGVPTSDYDPTVHNSLAEIIFLQQWGWWSFIFSPHCPLLHEFYSAAIAQSVKWLNKRGLLSSCPGRGKMIILSPSSRPILGPMHPIQWVPEVRRPRCEADHSPPSSAKIKNTYIYTPLPHTSSWCSA
jgi:hypothetical protein